MDVRRIFSIELDHPKNDLVTRFGLLQSKHTDTGVVQMYKRKGLAQRSLVLRRLEGDQRIIQPVGLPVSLSFAPIAGMSSQSKHKLVVAPVLIGLIAIS